MSSQLAPTTPRVLGFFDEARTRRLATAGRGVLRYGLVFLLLMWGAFKFFAFEAEAIRALVGNSPFMRWLYPALGVRGASALIGLVEVTAALFIALRVWKPRLSALGSLMAAGTFLCTLSFLFTAPGAFSPDSPFGGFLMKDLILLGAALTTAAEALTAAQQRAQGQPQIGRAAA